MRIRPVLLFLLASTCLALALAGCSKDNSPSQAGETTWRLYGKTYLVASVDPLPGVTVKCAGMTTVSGSDGSYEFRGVPEGTQIIAAEKSNCDNFSQSIEIKSDTRYFIFLTFNGTSVYGRVSNALEGPIASAKVAMHGVVAYTDASGQYTLPDIPHVTDTLYVSHPRYISYQTPLSLTTSFRQLDVSLKRDSLISGTVNFTRYVYEGLPNQVYLLPLDRLYLSSNRDDQGQYASGNLRHVYVDFDFPTILNNSVVSIIDASLQFCTDGPYPPAHFETFAVTSYWVHGRLTFNNQPAIGSSVYSGTVGDSLFRNYFTVLDTDGFNQLLTAYRANGMIYGVVMQGGRVTPIGFYSVYSSQFRPIITFKVRY